MNLIPGVFIVLVLLIPALAAPVAYSRRSSRQAGTVGAVAAGVAGLLSLSLLGMFMLGTGERSLVPMIAGVGFGIGADRLTIALLLLVTVVSCLVQAFASRYLQGDIRFGRFFLGAGLLTAATSLMISATTPVALALGWSSSGLAVLSLLGMYPGLTSAEEGRRSTLRVFLLGDLALWIAVGLGIVFLSGQNFVSTDPSGSDGVATELIAVLLVIAALSRSAQLPFRSWLPGTIAVPTPVSALLHAGVVNAGGILLIKTGGVFGSSELATYIAFSAGAATAIYATFAMIVRPDVKGALAHSTAGQMGFMIMTCGLGAWVATVFHLIGHSLYKASLFLGSGSTTTSETARLRTPGPSRVASSRPVRLAFSLFVPAVALLCFVLAWYPELNWTNAAILAFAWSTLAWAAYGWTGRKVGKAGMALALPVIAVAAAVYVALISLAYEYLGTSLPSDATEAASPALLLIFLPVLAIWIVIQSGRHRITRTLGDAAYVWTLNSTRTVRSSIPPGSPGRESVDSGSFVPRSQGAGS